MPIGMVAKDRHNHRYISSNASKWMAQGLSIANEVARGKVHHSKHSATLGESSQMVKPVDSDHTVTSCAACLCSVGRKMQNADRRILQCSPHMYILNSGGSLYIDGGSLARGFRQP